MISSTTSRSRTSSRLRPGGVVERLEGAVAEVCVAPDEEVVDDGQAGEQLGALERARDAGARDHVDREAVELLPVEADAALDCGR